MRTILIWSSLLLTSFAAAVAANSVEIVVKDEAQTRAERVQFLFDGLRAGTVTIDLDAKLLGWKDIPALLKHAESTLPIKDAGVGVVRPKNRPLTEGMAAVFLIERIRRGEAGLGMKPICHKFRLDPNNPGVVEPTEKELAALYTTWWAQVKDLDPTKGVKVEPLVGGLIFWETDGC